jgi:hypothetical protein
MFGNKSNRIKNLAYFMSVFKFPIPLLENLGSSARMRNRNEAQCSDASQESNEKYSVTVEVKLLLQLFRKLLPTSGFVFFIQNKENNSEKSKK